MKKIAFNFSMVLLFGALVFTGCKKKDTTPDDAATQQQNADDDSRVQSESEAAADDANAALSGDMNIDGGRTSATTAARPIALIAGADTVTYDTTSNIIRIHYDGATVLRGRTRSGYITAQLISGNNWDSAGAILLLTFDYTATRQKDNKTLTLTGQKTITNVSGGLVKNISGTQSVVHRIQTLVGGGLTVTYDNGAQKLWSTDRTRTITYTGSTTTAGSISIRDYRITLVGDTTVNGYTNVAWWGVTRDGESFYAEIPSTNPIVFDESESWFGPISGQLDIKGLTRELDVTYGLNSGGTPTTVTSPYLTPLYYQLSWTDLAGTSRTALIQYQ